MDRKKLIVSSTLVLVLGLGFATPTLANEGFHPRARWHHANSQQKQEWREKMKARFEELSPEEQERLKEFREEMRAHKEEMRESHLNHLSEVTGLSQEEIKERFENGENPKDILESQGLDPRQVHEDMHEQFKEDRQNWRRYIQDKFPGIWERIRNWFSSHRKN